ncbi:MAG: hypothetical protein HKN21_09790, partial [Candidatus Eisenbacteria bacterium]|nr:hypothetical protein [Candidatus Eisenbacteria bacterium]
MTRIAICLFLAFAFVAPTLAEAQEKPEFNPFQFLGDDGSVPAEWVGIWQIEATSRFCGSSEILTTTSIVDTLCESESFNQDDPEVDFNCSGSATATTMNMTCTGTNPAGPGCDQNLSIVFEGTRNGDTYTITATTNVTYSGDCSPELQDTCFVSTQTGTRISSDPGECKGVP